jgi:hypothetical protein
MAEQKKGKRRVGVWILIAVGGLILAGAVWLLLPLRYPLDTQTEPYDVVGYFQTRLDPEVGFGAFGVELAEARVLPDGGLSRFGFRLASALGFPRSVDGWLVAEPGATLPAAVVALDLGRAVRLIKLVHRVALPRVLFGGRPRTERVGSYRLRAPDSGVSDTPISAYAFVGDHFLVATSRAALSSLFHALDTGATGTQADVVDAFRSSEAEVQAYLTNRTGKLTDTVRGVEERVAFAALPSADALGSIHVTADIAPADDGYALTSETTFNHTDASRAREVYSDARFLYGALRRVARSQEVDLRGEVVEDASSVTLVLEAVGLETLFSPQEDGESDAEGSDG